MYVQCFFLYSSNTHLSFIYFFRSDFIDANKNVFFSKFFFIFFLNFFFYFFQIFFFFKNFFYLFYSKLTNIHQEIFIIKIKNHLTI